MRVVVVGAGFAGLLTTAHLLRNPSVEVALVEKGPVFGAGAAYSTDNPDHLLNVRASNMSAFEGDPGHLLSWLDSRGLPGGPDAFISRATYGGYLQSLLNRLTATPDTGRRLRLLSGEVTDLQHDGDWRSTVTGNGEVRSDVVVLALGNLEPMTPPALGGIATSPRYIVDPWRDLARVPAEASRILLVGSGLTMVDVALSLRRPDRDIVAISRRGLLPRAHAPHEALGSRLYQGGPIDSLRQVRAEARRADWRAVMDQLRPQTRSIWRSWPVTQRYRALRHLKPFWDVHRHRLAPEIASRIEEMRGARELSVHSGKVVEAEVVGEHVCVTWRARGSDATSSLIVDAVINCTGPQGDIRESDLPLLRNLLRRGDIVADRAGLGARVDDCCRLINASGCPTTGLYAVGPITRGAFWEITAAPEIRLQAAEVAAAISGPASPAEEVDPKA